MVFIVVMMVILSGCQDQKDEVKVYFDTNGGPLIDEITYDLSDATLELPQPTRAGYDFIGWYIDQTLENEVTYQDLLNRDVLTLYAKWAPDDRTYRVTYHTDDPDTSKTVDVKAYEKPEIYAPKKDGYVFSGWFLDEDYEDIYDYQLGITNYTVLFAKWEEVSDKVLTVVFTDDYTFKFNLDDNQMPEMKGIVPNELRLNVRRFFYDPFFRVDFDKDQADFDHSFTIYAELFQKNYVRYDQINFDFPEERLTDELMFKDGQIYYYKQKDAYAKDGSHELKIYEPYHFEDTILEDEYIIDAFSMSEQHIVITLENQKQYLVKFIIAPNYKAYTIIEELTFLDENEYVQQGQVMYNTFLFETNQGNLFYYGKIFQYTEFYETDVTDAFDLDEGEYLIFDYDRTDNYSIKTNMGNIYALSMALESFPDIIYVEEDKMFTKCNDHFVDEISLFKMFVGFDHIVYMTTDGHIYVKNLNLIEFHIDPNDFFEPGEEVVEFYGSIMITNHNRVFEHNENLEWVNLSETVFKDLDIEHYAFGYINNLLLIQTTNDEVYVYQKELLDITDELEAHQLDASQITSGPRFEIKDDQYTYVIHADGHIKTYRYGYVNTHILGAFKDGETAVTKNYVDENYQISGYLYQGKHLLQDMITVTNDMHLLLIYHDVDFESINLIVMGRQYTIEAVQGALIEEVDILQYLPEALEIAYLEDSRNQSTISLPFVVTKDLHINVITKPKTEALYMDIKFVTGSHVLTYETQYALEGDLIYDVMDIYVPWDYDIDYISYDIEGLREVSHQDMMMDDTVLYVHLKDKEYQTLTVHLTEDLEIVTDYNMQISPYAISSLISRYYHISFDSNNILGIYLDESMTEPWNYNHNMDEDLEIWLDILAYRTLHFYQVSEGEIVDRYDFMMFEGMEIDLSYLMQQYHKKYVEIDSVYYDQGLSQMVLDDDVINDQNHQLFYTTQPVDSFTVRVHIYDDLKDLYIESIDINYRNDQLADILGRYGYTLLGVFSSDDFSQPYLGNYEPGNEVYAKVLNEYVTLTMHDLDLDETYVMKYPKNISLENDILDIYLSEIDPLYHLYSFYKDEAFSIDAIHTYMTNDLTIYLKKDVTAYHHVIFEIDNYGVSYELYMEDQMMIDAMFVEQQILKMIDPLGDRYDLVLYEDALLTQEVSSIIIDQDMTIYIDLVEQQTYQITFKDIMTGEIIFTKTSPITKISLIPEVYEYYDIPLFYRNQLIVKTYLDMEKTSPISIIEIDDDQVIYVEVYEPNQFEVTYQFMGIELDDITMTLRENRSVNQIQILQALYEYYGSDVKISYSLVDLDNFQTITDFGIKSDMRIGIYVETLDVYVLTFVYLDVYGLEHYYYMRFVEGEKIDERIFYGTIIQNPNEENIKFHYTSELINGTSQITVHTSKTYYIEYIVDDHQ